MAEKDKIDLELRPVNPFVEADASTLKDGRLSSVQRKIAQFVEAEAKAKISRQYGIQPPPVKTIGPDAEEYRAEAERKQQEFFDKYKITRAEHNLLSDLIFFGELKLHFEALGHIFLISDLDPETRRYVIEIGQRATTSKIVHHLKIKAVSRTLKEIDGVPVSHLFLEQYLWKMQGKMLDLLYKMHLLTERYKMYLYEKLPNFCRTPTSRVRYAISNDLSVPINDPRMQNLSEEQIYWHYINAIKNQEIENDIVKDRMEFMTWFINPEMAKKINEKEEMSEEADLDVVKKYSFMNGIIDMIKGDMNEGQVSTVMDDLMSKMNKQDASKDKDPWDEPKDIEGLNPDDPFIRGIKRAAQKSEKPNPDEKDEGQVGMFGGDPKWYK